MDAWQDSSCFMAATDQAAPYQYDAMTGMEVPSNFAVEHYFNQFVVENSYQLNPDLINIPIDYQPAFDGHLDMIGNLLNPTEDFPFPPDDDPFPIDDGGILSNYDGTWEDDGVNHGFDVDGSSEVMDIFNV